MHCAGVDYPDLLHWLCVYSSGIYAATDWDSWVYRPVRETYTHATAAPASLFAAEPLYAHGIMRQNPACTLDSRRVSD